MKARIFTFFILACFISLAGVSKAQTVQPETSEQNSLKIILGAKNVWIPNPDCRRYSEQDNIDAMYVSIWIKGITTDHKDSDYKYTVSGGQIIGEGRYVRWNLHGSKPGTYTIALEIIENKEKRTATETVYVLEEACCGFCECATVSVSSSETFVYEGESIRFQAKVAGGTQEEVKYKWTVLGGEIVSGQGTPEITVKANSNNEESITAKIEIEGLCANCPNEESVIVKIKKK